jgi:hypothetical protein
MLEKFTGTELSAKRHSPENIIKKRKVVISQHTDIIILIKRINKHMCKNKPRCKKQTMH